MSDLSLPIIFSSFLIIFISELPDKTAIATLALSMRYKTAGVIIGTWLAFAIQTIVGVFAGSILLLFPQKPIHFITALAFIIFAIFAFTRNEKEELKEEKKEVEKDSHHRKKAFITSFLIIFASEWGDLSQLATAFLVARTGNPLSVGIGSILALWSVVILAVLIGKKLSQKLDLRKLNIISGIILLIVGLIIIISTLKT